MTISLVRQWILTPVTHYRLFHNFTRQDFLGQFAASVGGLLWLFLTPIVQILTYAFVFSVVFRMQPPEDFGDTSFVLFMVIGYLPWFAFADTISKSPMLLLEKAPLITKVMFPTQIIPVVGTVVPYLTHGIGFGVLLVYMIIQGYMNWLWLWIPFVFFLQFLFTMGLVAIISALCVFLRDLQQLVGILVFIWFFSDPDCLPHQHDSGRGDAKSFPAESDAQLCEYLQRGSIARSYAVHQLAHHHPGFPRKLSFWWLVLYAH